MHPTYHAGVQGAVPALSVHRSSGRRGLALIFALLCLALVGTTPLAVADEDSKDSKDSKSDSFTFDLVPTANAARCLPDARGEVRLTSRGANQQMQVRVSGLPAHTTFVVFVTQVP